MIISRTHNFVFAHVPKSGGIAMRAALEPFADGQAGTLVATTHETLPDLLARRPDLADHFKFAFVRNPWERLVSFHAYARRYLSRTLPEFEGLSFTAMLRLLDKGAAWIERLHAIRPQSEFVRGADFTGRFERLAEDFARVCARLGLSATLERRNASDHGAYASYYDDWSRGFVAARYANDIKEFGYSFGATP
jgi:Sulfotransferase family